MIYVWKCLPFKKVYYVPPEIAGLVTLKKAILTVQYIQLKQIHKVPEKSERCTTTLLRVEKESEI